MSKVEYDVLKLRELMELCGYENKDDLDRDIPRLMEVMPRARITPEDVKNAIPKMKMVYGADLELRSVRKALNIYLRRFISLMRCQEDFKKVVYHPHPGEPRHCLMLNFASDDIYADYPDAVFFTVQNYIFGNLSRYLEIGERNGLPPAHAHCGMNILMAGLIAEDIIPKPDVIVAVDWQCDQSHKLVQMVSELYDIPLLKVDSVFGEPWGCLPELYDRDIFYFGKNYDKFMKQTEEILGIEFTEEVKLKSNISYVRLWRLVDEAHRIYLEADPRPARFVITWLFEQFILEPERTVHKEGLPIMELYIKELKDRVSNGYGVIEKGSPKIILWHGIGTGDVMSLGQLVEDCGLNPVVPYSLTWLVPSEKVPPPDRFKNITFGERVALGYLRRPIMGAADHHAYRTTEIVKQTGVDGVVMSYVFQCRAFAGMPFIVKDVVEKATGIPCMLLEVSAYDGRECSYGSLRTRIETFGDLLRARKVAGVVTT